jgi:hypothetical protein
VVYIYPPVFLSDFSLSLSLSLIYPPVVFIKVSATVLETAVSHKITPMGYRIEKEEMF